jgi:predicted NAD/FAD-binding protein
MSFSVRDDRDGVEYSGSSLRHLYVQPSNLLRPSFHRMVADIFRFYREAPSLLEDEGVELTLGEYLRQNDYSRRFVEQHILPMGSALWSCGHQEMDDFPARFFVEFFQNHRMLHLRGRPQWQVIEGGSREYVRKLIVPFANRIRLRTPVTSIRREEKGVLLRAKGEDPRRFDRVILACHSDQALRILDDPTVAEREVLGAMPYSKNDTRLHTDNRVMPRKRAAWSSWNYHVTERDAEHASVTYHMNRLQGLSADNDYCVTLNDHEVVDDAKVLRWLHYEHPLYTRAGVAAQQRHAEVNGPRHTWYCGAYWGWGFHEDGVNSALRVCADFGARL